MNVYKLEHQYSRSHKFYGVRTTLTFHELNVLCAYLQLLHFELPRIDGAEDTIAEDNGEKLLKTIFMRIPMIPVSDSGDFDHASRAGYFLL
ncbi:hypothetical protein [Klebsiella michiganensis]|uniref:hypothetical protein n=1 Tax=Klebsiella michiganensis TaxID=1134687 RepID=UPI003D98B1BB